MSPAGNVQALAPGMLGFFQYCLAATLFIHLPFLGIVIGGSAASLVLNFLGRENEDGRSVRLSREVIEIAAVGKAALFIGALVPVPAVAFLWRELLAGQVPLPWYSWILPFGALMTGCALLSVYRSAVLRTAEPSATALRAGAAGVLAMASGAFLQYLLLGMLFNPAKLPLVGSHPVFLLSWSSLLEFGLFLALSFGLTGGIVLFSPARSPEASAEPDSEYGRYVRSVGAALAVAAALALPALVVLRLVSLPSTGLSTEVFVMAATVIVLALGVVAILSLIPEKRPAGAGARVSALFVVMFVAVLAGDWAAIGNASQGQSAPLMRQVAAEKVTPLAAEKVTKEGAPAKKPAAAAPAAGAAKGKKVFDAVCSACHRFDTKLVGPPIDKVLPKYKGNVEKLKGFIRNPVKVDPGYPSMPKPEIKEDEIDAVARYLLSKKK